MTDSASKQESKEAVEQLCKVYGTSVNTLSLKGKTKRFRCSPGRRRESKKAVGTLKDGDRIDISTGL